MDLKTVQRRQPVLPHKTLDIRYPRYSPDLDGSQGGGISDPPVLLNNNSSDPDTAMSACRTGGGSDHFDWSRDPPVENLVACMICMVVDETLGFSEADGSTLEPPQVSQQAPPREPLYEPEGRTLERI